MSGNRNKFTRVDIDDLVHPGFFTNPDTEIPREILTPLMPPIPRYRSSSLKEWQEQNERNPSKYIQENEAKTEAAEKEIPSQMETNINETEATGTPAAKEDQEG